MRCRCCFMNTYEYIHHKSAEPSEILFMWTEKKQKKKKITSKDMGELELQVFYKSLFFFFFFHFDSLALRGREKEKQTKDRGYIEHVYSWICCYAVGKLEKLHLLDWNLKSRNRNQLPKQIDFVMIGIQDIRVFNPLFCVCIFPFAFQLCYRETWDGHSL